MVSASEGVVYYCTVFLTALVFLTEASAITTNYEKSTAQNKTHESPELSPQRTKLTPTRSRSSNLSKNQNHDRVTPLILSKLKSPQKTEPITTANPEHELLIAANSGGENDVKDKGGGSADDDDQKTLSEQVADGKYGLIQHEIFTEKPQRPGVISYDVNPEVPKDNVNNLGGLEPEDIWLAENHLLVLAGNFNNGMQTQWRPIDNYVAPKRPVKIPPNPRVPPPFPVQLSENGPIEYIKTSNGGPPLSFIPFFNPLAMQYGNFNKTQSFPQPLYGKLPNFGQYGPPGVVPLKPSLPTQPPVLVKPPPGAEFIPPYLSGNITDAVDEDDPSLYYPPPYDFYYPIDNSSKVPPGPLVPGIVLPPPPDFFSLLTNKTAKSKEPVTKPKSTYKPNYSYKLAKQLNYPQFSQEDFTNIRPTSSSEKPKEQTTFITYDDIINEVTYPDSKHDKITYSDVKVNKVSTDEVDDWIPIPAPKPFYITGGKKPVKNTLLVMMESPLNGRVPKNGYAYERPGNPLKIVAIDQSTFAPYTEQNSKRTKIKFTNYLDGFPSIDQYRSTTPVTPLLQATKKPPPKTQYYSTTPAPSLFSSPQPSVDTIKATYYFYEEPEFSKPITNNGYTSKPFSTTSPLPVSAFNDYNSNTAKPQAPEKPPSANHESKRKPITPMIPIYYLAELENIVDLVKPMNLPYPDGKNSYYTSTSKPTYSINKPHYDRPTPRPIFEYSYVASDYNGPSSQISQSTPQTYHEPHYSSHYEYNPYYQQQQYQAIYNPLDYSKPVPTTAAPVLNVLLSEKPIFSNNAHGYQLSAQNQKPSNYDSFDRPWVPNPFSQFAYPTDNPYYAFFTREEEDLIDENTKKYFTIFGQKIKNVDSTTPIPVQTASTTSTRWSGRENAKYAKPSTQPSQPITSNYLDKPNNYGFNYYTSTVPYTPEYTTVKNHYQNPTTTHETDETQKLPISLHGDTLVNYVTPLPENPDAEYITPKLSKQHIRPIVVEDLPPDVNERLKNLMNSANHYNRQRPHKTIASTGSANKYRYVVVDNQQNNDYDSYNGHAYNDYTYDNTQPSSTPISLESDVLVNYKVTKLTKNPDAEEYIDSPSTAHQKDNEHYATDNERDRSDKQSQNTKQIDLHNDILVNYKNKARLAVNPDAEYTDNDKANSNKANTANIISYKYPGVEHGHFYFLTPQETRLTQIENERYDFQSDVEKPGGYFKRKPRNHQNVESTTVKSR